MRQVIELPKFRCSAGAVGSFALHLAFLIVFFNLEARIDPAPPEQPFSVVPLTASVFLYDEPATAPVSHYYEPPAIPEGLLDGISIPPPSLPEIEAVAADSFDESRGISSLDDLESVDRLQGIYVKQINDRIARVLELGGAGATSVDQCILYVIQNELGDVVDVDMNDCARSPEEQQRLTRAIFSASPLPRPPEGLAMGSYIKVDASSL